MLDVIDVAALSKKFIVDWLRWWILIFGWKCDRSNDGENVEWVLLNEKFFQKFSSHPCCRRWKLEERWYLVKRFRWSTFSREREYRNLTWWRRCWTSPGSDLVSNWLYSYWSSWLRRVIRSLDSGKDSWESDAALTYSSIARRYEEWIMWSILHHRYLYPWMNEREKEERNESSFRPISVFSSL